MPVDRGWSPVLWLKVCADACSDPGHQPVWAAADRGVPFFRFPLSVTPTPAPPTNDLLCVRFASGAWWPDSRPRSLSSSTACQHSCRASERLRVSLKARDLDRVLRSLGLC